jgi:hypothetical protein
MSHKCLSPPYLHISGSTVLGKYSWNPVSPISLILSTKQMATSKNKILLASRWIIGIFRVELNKARDDAENLGPGPTCQRKKPVKPRTGYFAKKGPCPAWPGCWARLSGPAAVMVGPGCPWPGLPEPNTTFVSQTNLASETTEKSYPRRIPSFHLAAAAAAAVLAGTPSFQLLLVPSAGTESRGY